MKNKFNINIEIAKHICIAQQCSEKAKVNSMYKNYYYDKKRDNIWKAIKLLDKNLNPMECKFNYYFDTCEIYWDHCYQKGQIVYFTYRDGSERLQISFHIPPYEVSPRRTHKGLKVKWDRKSSHYSCEVLKKVFNLKIREY